MKKSKPAGSPDEYIANLDGWRLKLVTSLRKSVLAASPLLEEVIKWGHIVYLCECPGGGPGVPGGPGAVLLIRAEEERVLFGFWRGRQLTAIEPRLKPSGKYDMATLELREGMTIKPTTIRQLTKEAIALNKKHGNPQDDARKR